MATGNKASNQGQAGSRSAGQASDERQQREERVLDAAAALLVRWGYRKTTIDDVAREAGVGKGTIYLRWKNKNDLFRAAIWREFQKVTAEMKQRMAADPEGGLVHRVWTHGMLAVCSHPLVAALIKGHLDIFQGLIDAFDQQTLNQLFDHTEESLTRLQSVGLVRADLSVSVITFLIGALKLGLIYAADFAGQAHTPSTEQLAEAISDLIGRWLEPARLPGDSAAGKEIWNTWLETTSEIVTPSLTGGE